MRKPKYVFEHKTRPILPRAEFIKRQFTFVVFALSLLTVSLLIGMLGYHELGRMNWTDSFYNASMILTGMGPVDDLPTPLAKYFAGTFALFSGIVFLSTVGIMFAPLVHRLLHLMHMDEGDHA